jgi:hypothetical protein
MHVNKLFNVYNTYVFMYRLPIYIWLENEFKFKLFAIQINCDIMQVVVGRLRSVSGDGRESLAIQGGNPVSVLATCRTTCNSLGCGVGLCT